jgi:hypothetical protein
MVNGAQRYFQQFSAISWRSGLLVEESKVPVENHRPAAIQTYRY